MAHVNEGNYSCSRRNSRILCGFGRQIQEFIAVVVSKRIFSQTQVHKQFNRVELAPSLGVNVFWEFEGGSFPFQLEIMRRFLEQLAVEQGMICTCQGSGSRFQDQVVKRTMSKIPWTRVVHSRKEGAVKRKDKKVSRDLT